MTPNEKLLREELRILAQAADNFAMDVNSGAMDERIEMARQALAATEQPTGQEAFNAGMRAGRDLQWPTPASDAGARDAALEEVAQLLLNGHFLHDQAPPKLFAVEAAKAIRALKTTPAKPAQDLVAAIEELEAPNCGRLHMDYYIGFYDGIKAAAGLVAAHLKGTP